MKKIFLLTLLCTLFIGADMKAQEVTYVEDPSQGYTFNRFKDNWFISAEGGASLLFSDNDKAGSVGDRIGGTFNLGVGKWFSPIIGLRISGDFTLQKGATVDGLGQEYKPEVVEGRYMVNRQYAIGAAADVYLNLTNWWLGYKPGRVYNGIFYAGAAAHCQMVKQPEGNGDDYSWDRPGSSLGLRFGLLNAFAVSKHVDILLDLRLNVNNNHFMDYTHLFNCDGQILVGLAYKFNRTDWNAPIVPVCPTYKYSDAEGDALVERLKAADAKIADLERQLRDCMNRPAPAPAPAVKEGPLATIYFPIGSSQVQGVQSKVAAAVAKTIADGNDSYVVTGYADNGTGSAARNQKLREQRAANVAKILTRNGVDESRIETTTNSNDRYTDAPDLDRAATIEIK